MAYTDAWNLVRDCEQAGYTLSVTETKDILVVPDDVPEELVGRLISCKPDVVRLLCDRAKEPDSLESLRRFAPALWQLATLDDGRVVLVWGVTPHGVIVTPGPNSTLLTVRPGSVRFPLDA